MKRKKSEVDATKQTLAAAEGVIDLDPMTDERSATFARTNSPSATEIEAGQGVGPVVGEAHGNPKPKRKYTRRSKSLEPAHVEALVNNNGVFSRAVENFRAYFNGELTREAFDAKISDLQTLQAIAQRVDAK